MDPLRTILSCIDLTSLEGTYNTERITALCRKAISYGERGLPLPAAVCIYPVFIGTARRLLKGTGIRIASVAGAFPAGQAPLSLRLEEAKYAVNEGTDEIDMVISRGKLLEGDDSYVFDEIASFREISKGIRLKVILETGELKTDDLIRKAARIAISAGADFLKTSTGKVQPGATPGSVAILLEMIREENVKTGRKVGIKPSGGISYPSVASGYLRLVQQVLGNGWLNPSLFRIGASRLADAIAGEILPASSP